MHSEPTLSVSQASCMQHTVCAMGQWRERAFRQVNLDIWDGHAELGVKVLKLYALPCKGILHIDGTSSASLAWPAAPNLDSSGVLQVQLGVQEGQTLGEGQAYDHQRCQRGFCGKAGAAGHPGGARADGEQGAGVAAGGPERRQRVRCRVRDRVARAAARAARRRRVRL